MQDDHKNQTQEHNNDEKKRQGVDYTDPSMEKEEEPLIIPDKGSSNPMGGENNTTGNSADRLGDQSNMSGGSYQKSNKEI